MSDTYGNASAGMNAARNNGIDTRSDQTDPIAKAKGMGEDVPTRPRTWRDR